MLNIFDVCSVFKLHGFPFLMFLNIAQNPFYLNADGHVLSESQFQQGKYHQSCCSVVLLLYCVLFVVLLIYCVLFVVFVVCSVVDILCVVCMLLLYCVLSVVLLFYSVLSIVVVIVTLGVVCKCCCMSSVGVIIEHVDRFFVLYWSDLVQSSVQWMFMHYSNVL